MKERSDAAARIARVRAEMARMAHWRRIASERRLAELDEARKGLDAFTTGTQLTGALARLALTQAGRLDRRITDATAARDRQAGAHTEAERQRRLAETTAERLAHDVRRADERRELERLVEALAIRPPGEPTSLP